MSGDFEPEQKRYLEGFVAGLQIAKNARAADGAAAPANAAAAEPVGPDAAALRAQDHVIKAGGKLSDPEKFKRELHPFDGYEKLKDQASRNEAPSARSASMRRFSRARSNRIVSCGSQRTVAPAETSSLTETSVASPFDR